MKRVAIIATALVLSAGSATAEDFAPEGFVNFIDGNRLYKYCTSVSLADQSVCQGYVQGASDMLNVLRASLIQKNCTNARVYSGQVHDVVVNFLRQRPELRHGSAGELIFLALTDAFCPGKIPEPPKKTDTPLGVNTR